MKSYLLAKGWSLRRIHDLTALLDDISEYSAEFEPYRDSCQEITGFYFIQRYPFLGEAGPSEADVISAYKAVQPLIDSLRKAVEEAPE